MEAFKPLEKLGKYALCLAAAAVLRRPGRTKRAKERLPRPSKVLLVRLDDRVGEALLTTPVLSSLSALSPAPEVDVLVHPKMARVWAEHPSCRRIHTLDRRSLWAGALSSTMRALRSQRYDVVVDCSNWTAPSVASAIAARLAGPRSAVLGPSSGPTRWLRDVPVEPLPGVRREVIQRVHLLSPLPGHQPKDGLSFRVPRPTDQVAAFIHQLPSPYAVVNPGGRLTARRIPPEAFSAACKALAAKAMTPVVTWGPGERDTAEQIAQSAAGAKLAPPTGIDDLAALMAKAALTVCNNTGPMHLSVAVGTPTLAFFVRMDVERWGHPQSPHRMVDLSPLLEREPELLAEVESETRAFIAQRTKSQAL